MALSHGAIPIAIYRRRTTKHPPRPQSIFAQPPPPTPTQDFSFVSIPLGRTMTNTSMASTNHHLFSMDAPRHHDDDQNSIRIGVHGPSMSSLTTNQERLTHNQATWQSNSGTAAAANHLAQLLDDSNRLDNELPFVVTNPLPDLVLDDMDRIFVLRLE
jgi:hypothetical protein